VTSNIGDPIISNALSVSSVLRPGTGALQFHLKTRFTTNPAPRCLSICVQVKIKLIHAMKKFQIFALILFAAIAVHAQPPSFPPRFPPASTASAAPARDPVNYTIHVEWTATNDAPKFLEVLTTDGSFDLNTVQKNSVKINNNEVPITLKFSGSLTTLDDEKGRLQLFLGRTIPYVTGSYGSGPSASSSYSQMSAGLNSTFVVKFGQPQVIQSDENEKITVLVKRAE